MGSSTGISCRECGYSKDFRIGIGKLYYTENIMNFDSEFALLPYLIRSKKSVNYIQQLFNEKDAVIGDGYSHEIYRCDKCSEFYERFFIHLDYGGGNYEVKYKCTKCKTVLKLIDYNVSEVDDVWIEKEIDLQKYPCPRCGKHSLYESGGMMLWD